ncbi:Hypothetical predicted protein [Octopus vulgaris]|uniref:Uncharacterized protein n=1 Tax=Octopus vulgaris TaxID=6645 RepID=A0AA36B2J2_OCTVU|nr:Hypothetical predicted protein [Octopus vulgaris]
MHFYSFFLKMLDRDLNTIHLLFHSGSEKSGGDKNIHSRNTGNVEMGQNKDITSKEKKEIVEKGIQQL